MKRSPRNPQQQVVIGLIMAGLGLLFLLDNFNVFDAVRRVLPFWPMVLVAVGLFKVFQTEDQNGQFGGAVLVLVGGVLTLRHLGFLDFRWRDWWPLLLIGMGLFIIGRGQGRWGGIGQLSEGVLQGDSVKLSTLMGGHKTRVDSPRFSGGELQAIMGGIELDLRRASIEGGMAQVNVFILWGALELKVPDDWSITVNGTPLLGAIDDKTVPPAVPTKRLVINGQVIMGAIEIRN